MKNLLIFGLIALGLLLVAGIVLYGSSQTKDVPENKVYQGPVRPGDDEAYFRLTGITKPLEVKE